MVGVEECDTNGDTAGCIGCVIQALYVCSEDGNGLSTCTFTCGNGVRDSATNEGCDDGNTNNGDGCSGVCVIESPYICDPNTFDAGVSICTLCGNGQTDAGEDCDASSSDPIPSGFNCDNCALVSQQVCGNGIQEGNEVCDDPHNAFGCADDCLSILSGFNLVCSPICNIQCQNGATLNNVALPQNVVDAFVATGAT